PRLAGPSGDAHPPRARRRGLGDGLHLLLGNRPDPARRRHRAVVRRAIDRAPPRGTPARRAYPPGRDRRLARRARRGRGDHLRPGPGRWMVGRRGLGHRLGARFLAALCLESRAPAAAGARRGAARGGGVPDRRGLPRAARLRAAGLRHAGARDLARDRRGGRARARRGAPPRLVLRSRRGAGAGAARVLGVPVGGAVRLAVLRRASHAAGPARRRADRRRLLDRRAQTADRADRGLAGRPLGRGLGLLLVAEPGRLPDQPERPAEKRRQHQRERHRHDVERFVVPAGVSKGHGSISCLPPPCPRGLDRASASANPAPSRPEPADPEDRSPMTQVGKNSLDTRSTLTVGGKSYAYYSLAKAAEKIGDVSRLPFSMKVLLENLLRFEDAGFTVSVGDIQALADWQQNPVTGKEIQYRPARVLMQDFTGVPCVVDLAAMRDAIARLGGDTSKINPLVPVNLVIDHSVMVDEFGHPKAFEKNAELEYARNAARYDFLKWGSKSFRHFSALPPGTGICHPVNLEHIAQGVWSSQDESGQMVAYPDTCVGTDSHTTMVNGLGVLGWGVGGIEAEAAMLGQPVSMLIPEVVGFKLTGSLAEGVTATDLVLTCV